MTTHTGTKSPVTPLWFGREPSVYLAVFVAGLQGITAFGFEVSGEMQGIITAIATTLVGLAVAWMAGDGVIAAATGFAQAVVSLIVAFGWDATAEEQARILAFVTLALGLYVRDKVIAPVSAGQVSGAMGAKRAA